MSFIRTRCIKNRRVISVFVLLIALPIFAAPSHSSENTSCIVIYGDTRTNHDIHRNIVEAIMKCEPRAVFHTGDFVCNNLRDWKVFNEITSDLRKKAEFYPVIGNHDYETGIKYYFDNFELPNNEQWYSVEREGIHFIILDSNIRIVRESSQCEWLESDLKNTDKNKFIVVLFHNPPFNSKYRKTTAEEEKLRKTIVPLLEKYNVDMVFNGDFHSYERLLYNSIHYITTGGGGAPLHDRRHKYPYSKKCLKTYHFCTLYIKNNSLFVDVFDIDSKLIDQFSAEKKK